MPHNEQYAKLKEKFEQVFSIDKNKNIELKSHFKIPPFKLVFVEGGKFDISRASEDNTKKKEIELSSFYIAEFLLTQEIYEAVIGKTPSRFKGKKKPVDQVSWIEAMEFCNKLNTKIGFSEICDNNYNLLDSNGKKTNNIENVAGFRLPTEAEWGYVALGGKNQSKKEFFKYAGSNNIEDVGWYDGNSNMETKPVGMKFPNRLGIYDLSGNVWEWCLDLHDKDFLEKTQTKNPANLRNGSGRVLRGGSWFNYADDCRMAYRFNFMPDFRFYNFGLRLLFALQFTS
ncbi:MAG: formylglycine-generating enzyme family protein [Bacteroidetes bacterium]|nr:formylglycine-generating enzyme family protein [Bacteroidota bacterium]